jgi:nucleotide-binding universal stress UspA family protein
MYRKILVPLDGSALAECVLPHVESIARGCGTQDVIFFRAIEPFNFPSATEGYLSENVIKEIDTQYRASVEKYLSELVGRSKYDNVNVRSEIVNEKAADAIVDYAKKNEIDLIIIATHGRSGVSRWIWGSVADRVLRSACVPVLMIRAPGCVPGI